MIKEYRKFYEKKDYTSIGLFKELKSMFKIKKVLYPGSFIHLTPSLVFPKVVYVDSDRRLKKFFEAEDVSAFIAKNKKYDQKAKFRAYQQDYTKSFPEKEKSFDLLISQYAGFVSQACKKYLSKGGILVVNNSHGDASIAKLDNDFEFISVYNRKSDKKFSISDKNPESYFIPKRGRLMSKTELTRRMRGQAFTKSPSGYIFRKIR